MPRRKTPKPRKTDGIFYPDATKEEQHAHLATSPFDEAVDAMDLKWGIDRLPGLVSPETAARYGLALAELNEAIREPNAAAAIARAANCIRGLKAMDAEATAAGHKTADTEVWEIEIDGTVCGIMRDHRSWKAIKAERPDLILYSLREVAIACGQKGFTSEPVQAVKAHFPGSQVIKADAGAQAKPMDNLDELENF